MEGFITLLILPEKLTKLPHGFYSRNTVQVARNLLGKIIVRKFNGKILSGKIVETEAYTGKDDSASHSFNGKTNRNAMMFEKGGKAYVYFTYGNHYCFNVVTGKENNGCAVLIRAVEPLTGLETMIKNRGVKELHNLTDGPGKFTQAFAINKNLNGADLTGDKIYIAYPNGLRAGKHKIVSSSRIGITRNTDKLYRFYIADNPYVSRLNRATTKIGLFVPRLGLLVPRLHKT